MINSEAGIAAGFVILFVGIILIFMGFSSTDEELRGIAIVIGVIFSLVGVVTAALSG